MALPKASIWGSSVDRIWASNRARSRSRVLRCWGSWARVGRWVGLWWAGCLFAFGSWV